jgi:hypothetical protein
MMLHFRQKHAKRRDPARLYRDMPLLRCISPLLMWWTAPAPGDESP